MLVQHRQGKVKGMFYVEQDKKILAEMVYSTPNEGQMLIEHTEVDDSLGGQGVGKQLVYAAVEYAREHNIKIIPLCTFAKATLDRNKDWQDVLFKA